MYSELNLSIGEWIKFNHNGMMLTGEIVKPPHTMAGIEGRYFTVMLYNPAIEMTFRIDRVNGIQRTEPPLFSL